MTRYFPRLPGNFPETSRKCLHYNIPLLNSRRVETIPLPPPAAHPRQKEEDENAHARMRCRTRINFHFISLARKRSSRAHMCPSKRPRARTCIDEPLGLHAKASDLQVQSLRVLCLPPSSGTRRNTNTLSCTQFISFPHMASCRPAMYMLEKSQPHESGRASHDHPIPKTIPYPQCTRILASKDPWVGHHHAIFEVPCES